SGRLASLLVVIAAEAAGAPPATPSDSPSDSATVQPPETSPPSATAAQPPETSRAPSETPPSPSMPPCADPDAEGPFLSSTGCSGVFGLRGSATSVRGASASEGSGL